MGQSVTAGLYGKLPGRGDFIRHGWDETIIEALDLWLAEGLAAWRPEDDAAFASQFSAVPLYIFYMPAGWIGASALHGVISPSVDRAGRYFFLVAGVASSAAAAWHLAVACAAFADSVEAATYAALGPESDPDTLIAAVTAAIPADIDSLAWRAGLATPADAVFWALGEGEPHIVRGARPDAALLASLLEIDQSPGDGE